MLDPDQWIKDMEAKAADMKAKSEAMTAELTQTQVTLSSSNGAVTITVSPNGALADLKLGHRACELGHSQLSALIMETFRKAQREISRQVVATLEEYFPDSPETLNHMLDLNPYDLDEEEEETPQGWQPELEPEPEPEPVRAPQRRVPAAAPVRRRRDEDDLDELSDRPW